MLMTVRCCKNKRKAMSWYPLSGAHVGKKLQPMILGNAESTGDEQKIRPMNTYKACLILRCLAICWMLSKTFKSFPWAVMISRCTSKITAHILVSMTRAEKHSFIHRRCAAKNLLLKIIKPVYSGTRKKNIQTQQTTNEKKVVPPGMSSRPRIMCFDGLLFPVSHP